MLRLSSADLFSVSDELGALAQHQMLTVLHNERVWQQFRTAGNSARFLEAAHTADTSKMIKYRDNITQMSAVSEVLTRTASTVAAIELDLGNLYAAMDRSLQHSELAEQLLAEIQSLGRAIDRACAVEIMAICTEQRPTTHSLSDFSDAELAEIHAMTYATAAPEVHALAERFPEAYLLPSSDGVALAFGEIDTAPSVVTVIPGAGSAAPASWADYAMRTSELAKSTGGAAVLWIDYRAPKDVVAALSTAPATAGAQRLRDFQAELRRRTARNGIDSHLAVVGHSYGSVVAGHAARGHGLDADSLVLLGSPGVGVQSASDLNLKADAPRIIAVTSPHDPIGLAVSGKAGAHGPDPADPAFGAEAWPAAGGHSDYWSDPSFHSRLRGLVKN